MKHGLFVVLAIAVLEAPAQRLTPLAPAPAWTQLNKYQESITREDFEFLLEEVYAPSGASKPFVVIDDEVATIQTRPGHPPFVLRFAASDENVQPAPRFWRQKMQMPPNPPGKPLAGVHIAIDAGHLGGPFARMEERWFQIGDSKPVTEGDMTLLVARLLVPRLKALGAKVTLTRSLPGPVTRQRPEDFAQLVVGETTDATPDSLVALQSEAERLFYRVSEIRERARLVNEVIRPDLVICLHFNAEPWGDPDSPELTETNHLHFLVTGAFSERELSFEDQRFDMLDKLLSRAFSEELAVTEAMADTMARATQLPPYEYLGSNAVKVGTSPYVWGRNLLANRLFRCPVVYIEPYVMNSREVFERIQEGDYRGLRRVAGRARPSIFREYADAVVQGLVAYYSDK